MGNCSGHDQDVAVSKVVQVFREQQQQTPPPTPSSSRSTVVTVDISDIPEEEIAESE